MAETLIGVGYELLTHAGHATIDHVSARLKPPTPPVFAAPAWAPPAWAPPAAAMMAGAAAGGAGMALAEAPGTPDIGGDTPTTTTPSSYSDQVAQGIACLACTRGHLATMTVAAAEAQRAVARGDLDTARRQWVVVASEADALVAYDWHPDKLAATPSADVAIVEALRPCVEGVRAAIPTPASVATAYGSLVEARRFARSERVTARDREEIEVRLAEVDARGNYAERVELADRDDVAQALRAGRHVLDGADPYDPAALGQAAAHYERAAVAATPAPTADEAAAVLAQCTECRDQFYARYFAAMRARNGG